MKKDCSLSKTPSVSRSKSDESRNRSSSSNRDSKSVKSKSKETDSSVNISKNSSSKSKSRSADKKKKKKSKYYKIIFGLNDLFIIKESIKKRKIKIENKKVDLNLLTVILVQILVLGPGLNHALVQIIKKMTNLNHLNLIKNLNKIHLLIIMRR